MPETAPATAPAARAGKLEATALLLGVVLFGVLLAPMLRQPFWLDETATWWQIQGGFDEIAGRTRAWPTQSLAHGYLARAALELLPGREVALRLPSVAAGLLALGLFHRLVRGSAGAVGAAVATLALLGHPHLLETIAMARPYAFGLLALVLSWTGLVGWARTGRRRDLALWALGSAAVPWFHFTLLLGIAAQLPLAARVLTGGGRARRREALLAAAASLLLAAPTLPQLASIALAGDRLGFAGRPGLATIASVLLPQWLGLVILAASLLARSTTPVQAESRPRAGLLTVDAVALWLLPPAMGLLFTFGLGIQLFFPRYLLASFLGLAVCAGLWAARLERRAARLALVLLALLVPTAAREGVWPRFTESNWRAASHRIRSELAAGGVPVLSITPYVESRFPEHLRDLEPGGMLLSMYAAYPVPARVHGLPSVCDSLGRRRLETLWRELDLAAAPRVLVVRRFGDRYDGCLAEVAPGRRSVPLASWGRVELLALERPTS